jgi:hypothetical protein
MNLIVNRIAVGSNFQDQLTDRHLAADLHCVEDLAHLFALLFLFFFAPASHEKEYAPSGQKKHDHCEHCTTNDGTARSKRSISDAGGQPS